MSDTNHAAIKKKELNYIDRCKIGWRALRLFSEGREAEARLLLQELVPDDDPKKGGTI